MSRQRGVKKSTITSKLFPAPPTEPKRPRQAVQDTSSKTRTRSIFKRPTTLQDDKVTSHVNENEVENILTNPLPRRPPSSLSKFRVLPNISKENSWSNDWDEIDVMTNEAQQMILDSSLQPRVEVVRNEASTSKTSPKADKRKNVNAQLQNTNTSSPQRKKTKLTSTNPFAKKTVTNPRREAEKTKQAENITREKLNIALKLPDGRRMEKPFWSSDHIRDVMEYIQSEVPHKIKDLNIYTMQSVPKVRLHNWDLSLKTLGIKNRTVLYIEEKDE